MKRIWAFIQNAFMFAFIFLIGVAMLNALFTPQSQLVGMWKF